MMRRAVFVVCDEYSVCSNVPLPRGPPSASAPRLAPRPARVSRGCGRPRCPRTPHPGGRSAGPPAPPPITRSHHQRERCEEHYHDARAAPPYCTPTHSHKWLHVPMFRSAVSSVMQSACVRPFAISDESLGWHSRKISSMRHAAPEAMRCGNTAKLIHHAHYQGTAIGHGFKGLH